MLQNNQYEDPSGKPRRILLAADDPSIRALVPTFLTTMGWQCPAVANVQDAVALIEREIFDAILLGMGDSAAVERGILQIRQIRPSLADRILVISTGAGELAIRELVERYGLLSLSQEVLVQQLWSTLHELLARSGTRGAVAKVPQIAKMTFDSFHSPVTSGVRSSRASARQLAYEYQSTMIDLSIQSPEGSGRVQLAGQVLDAARKKERNQGLSVILTNGEESLGRTTTNQFGEFNLEFDCPENAGLEIRLGEKLWVSVPLGRMDWVKRMPGLPANG